ncbi:hypothetical protein D6774_00755 [Candidatus Woesearchaeota archaeon]|nr:MAG: hypothetical protein D6774_00755 [Candidatus Woesearchaeota archaeon]
MKLEIDTERDSLEHLAHIAQMLLAMAGKKPEQNQVYRRESRRLRPRDITRQQATSTAPVNPSEYPSSGSPSYSQIHTPQQQALPVRDDNQQQQQAASTPLLNLFQENPQPAQQQVQQQHSAQQQSQQQSAYQSSTVQSTQSIFDMFAQPEEKQHEKQQAEEDASLEGIQIIPY